MTLQWAAGARVHTGLEQWVWGRGEWRRFRARVGGGAAIQRMAGVREKGQQGREGNWGVGRRIGAVQRQGGRWSGATTGGWGKGTHRVGGCCGGRCGGEGEEVQGQVWKRSSAIMGG